MLRGAARAAPVLQLLGHALLHQRRFDDAEAAFREAEAVESVPALARYHIGLMHLLRGDASRGWPGWEERLAVPAFRHPRLPLPRWRGEADARGRLLILGEQGFGDMLQFARFLPAAKARFGGRVTLGVAPALQGVLAAFCAASGVELARGERLEAAAHDRHAFLCSLPAILGLSLPECGMAAPYLAAEAGRLAVWRRRRPARMRCVGLVWEGRASHPQDALRSLPPEKLLPLREVAGLCLVGLQRPPVARAAPSGLLDMNWGPDIEGFDDTAAMLGALDLLVTVDTAVAHLAGALGVRTLMLLPAVPDWRWGLEGEGSGWYPSLRLLRQERAGQWEGVVRRLVTEA